jgi:hypothetical protein
MKTKKLTVMTGRQFLDKVSKPKKRGTSLAHTAARLILRPQAESQSLGQRIGGWVGDKIQSGIKWITGMGDYTVHQNSLVTATGEEPAAFKAGKHSTTICHREFIANVTTGQASGGVTPFTINAYPLNPKSSLFPWLSEIALSFEQFRVKGMIVCFKSTSATAVASTNTALGSVILATQYNVLAPPFTSQQQMEAYEFCTSCNPSESMTHPVECAPNLTSVSELYIDDAATGDPRLNYLGTVFIATVGQQAQSQVGELWVSYEIELIRPKLFTSVSNLGLTSIYGFSGSAGSGGLVTSNQNSNVWNPIVGHQLLNSDFGLQLTTGSNVLTFPGWIHGTVQIIAVWALTANANTGFTAGPATLTGGSGTVIPFAPFGSGNGSWDTYGPGFGGSTANNTATAGFFLTLTGQNPGVPVTVAWSPLGGSSGSDSISSMYLVATTIAMDAASISTFSQTKPG